MSRLLVFCVVCVGTLGKPGGWSNIDVNDETVKEMARFAATELGRRSNSLYQSRLLDVVKARSQVIEVERFLKIY